MSGSEGLTPCAPTIAEQALRRGVRVEVTDGGRGKTRFSHGRRSILTRGSRSELTGVRSARTIGIPGGRPRSATRPG